jgi:signal peptidase I
MSLVLERCPFLAGADYSLKAVGYSMFPVERTGDMVLVRKGIKNIQVGSIICFWRGLELIGHRVIEIQIYPNMMFKTKGDNNKYTDGWIQLNSVVGKEILIIPLGVFITKNAFFIASGLIILLILIMVFYSFPEILLDLDILFLVIILAFAINKLLSP